MQRSIALNAVRLQYAEDDVEGDAVETLLRSALARARGEGADAVYARGGGRSARAAGVKLG